jgi:ATP-dependent exoDNAse (exonuclease V) beta subunit
MSNPRREIIEAGAGCGKTTRLVSRYIEALGNSKTGFRDPTRVFAVTFTSESAREMKERVVAELVKQGRKEEALRVEQGNGISTIHALLYRILKPFLSRFNYPTEITPPHIAQHYRKLYVLNNAAQIEELPFLLSFLTLPQISQMAAERVGLDVGQVSDFPFPDFSTHIEKFLSELKNDFQAALAQDPKVFKALNSGEDLGWISATQEYFNTPREKALFEFDFRKAQTFKKNNASLYKRCRSLSMALSDKLFERVSKDRLTKEKQLSFKIENSLRSLASRFPKYLDFNLIELLFLKIPAEDLKSHIPEVILVDEFQDTSPTQFDIIKKLSSDTTEWFFVGDPKQSIYGFREAHATLFAQLTQTLSHSQLSTNYRSDSKLLSHMNELSSLIFDEKFLGIPSLNDPPAQTLSPARDSGLDTSLSIYRFSKSVDLSQMFEQALLEIQKRTAQLGPSASHGVLFLKWNRLYEFADFLRSKGIDFEISGSDNFLEHPLSSIFTTFINYALDLEHPLLKSTVEKWLDFSKMTLPRELLKSQSPARLIKEFCLACPLEHWHNGNIWAIEFENLIVELEESRQWSQKHDLWDTIQLFKYSQLKALSESSWSQMVPKKSNSSIQLLTVHASKGLQFDNVVILETFESTQGAPKSSSINFEGWTLFPRLPHQDYIAPKSRLFEQALNTKLKAEYAEKKRLFYVAITRAKNSLSVFYKTRSKSLEEDYQDKITKSYWDIINETPAMPVFWNSFFDLFLNTPYALNAIEAKSLSQSDIEPSSEPGQTNQTKEAELTDSTPKLFNAKEVLDPKPQFSLPQGHLSLGISSFVELLSRNLIQKQNTPKYSVDSNTTNYARLGENIHSILELWSGKDNELDHLIDSLGTSSDDALLKNSLLGLKNIPQLAPLWSELGSHPNTLKVLREHPISLKIDSYVLKGVSDLVWLNDNENAVIIDWKSTHFANLENNPARLNKIELQLKLYALALRKLARSITVAAVQIYSQDSEHTEAKILFWKKVDPDQIELEVKQRLSELQTQSLHPF